MTTKVLDNTFISAALREITSVDLITKCSQEYNLITSKEVFKETNAGFQEELVKKVYNYIKVVPINETKIFQTLFPYMKDRYPFLHDGEIATFLLAIIFHVKNGGKCYFVTDDKKMREIAKSIIDGKDNLFLNKIKRLGFKKIEIGITGTVGLIIRLCKKRVISKEEASKITEDIRNGTFRITEELIALLEVECNES